METDGFEATADVLEVGWCDVDVETRAVGHPQSYLCRVEHSPPDSRAIHHIRASDTAGFPPYDRRILFEEAARAGVVTFAAHTADHEAKFIMGSIPLICTHKASLRVWPEAPSHSVFGLLYWLEDSDLVSFDRAAAQPSHRAGPDAYATAHLLAAMLAGGVTGAELFQWTREPRVLPRCPIGKYRGRPWAEVDSGFLEWILSKHDMEPDFRWNAARELAGKNVMNLWVWHLLAK